MKQPAYVIREADEAILLALARFHYLTAAQVSRLFYPTMQDRNREAQRRTKDLADAGYILRLGGALPQQQYGRRANVCTLTDKGRKYVQELGATVQPYFRPQEERRAYQNFPFMRHTLASIDVLITAERLCLAYDVSCPQMLTERDLKQTALRVDVPAGPNGQNTRSVAVIPDGWFQLQVGEHQPISIALELDRATEVQKIWRQKVAAYAVWAGENGPYAKAFETDNLTIAVVCPDERRCRMLIDWTLRELRLRNTEGFAELFLFTYASSETTNPYDFFFAPLWITTERGGLVPLLDTPPAPMTTSSGPQEGVIYSSV
jgi:hypothetical protein